MGLSRARAGHLAAVAAVALGLPVALGAQSAVRSARLTADLETDGSATVTIDYELTAAAAPQQVEVALLGFDVATTDEVVADGRTVPLERATGSRRLGSLALEGAVSEDAVRRVSLAYRVAEATVLRDGRLRARIPVATLSLPSAADSGAVFRARLTLPEGWSVVEGFPSGLAALEPRVYATELRVVPSVVSIRGRTDDAWRPGIELLIDLLTVSILAGFGVFGWRHMRGLSA